MSKATDLFWRRTEIRGWTGGIERELSSLLSVCWRCQHIGYKGEACDSVHVAPKLAGACPVCPAPSMSIGHVFTRQKKPPKKVKLWSIWRRRCEGFGLFQKHAWVWTTFISGGQQVIAYPALCLLWKGCLASALYFHKTSCWVRPTCLILRSECQTDRQTDTQSG